MDLANVMKDGSCIDLLDLVGGHLGFLRNRLRERSDTDRMARCVRVSCFDGLDHQIEKFAPAILELPIQAVDMTNNNYRNDYANQTQWAES